MYTYMYECIYVCVYMYYNTHLCVPLGHSYALAAAAGSRRPAVTVSRQKAALPAYTQRIGYDCI
jgi:hypothetical protein